jgi:hypothetical protein
VGGTITTIAGAGTVGFSGDGGPATAAELSGPSGISVDGSGNVYIADYNNNRIRKITAATGVISTIAGTGVAGFSGDNGLATAAQLDGPSAVAVDATGNVFIADQNNNRIRKIISVANSVEGIAAAASVTAYPNPTNGSFLVHISELKAGAAVLVTDVTGKIIASRKVDKGESAPLAFDLRGVVRGSYFIHVSNGQLDYRTTIVVQ